MKTGKSTYFYIKIYKQFKQSIFTDKFFFSFAFNQDTHFKKFFTSQIIVAWFDTLIAFSVYGSSVLNIYIYPIKRKYS